MSRKALKMDSFILFAGTANPGLAQALARSIEALLNAGARPEITIAATHGLFVEGAGAKLSHPSVRAIFVTDTVATKETDWKQLQIVSIAPLIAKAIQRFKSDGSISDLL
jgi:ribose-phosphate pyrophosphokinase